MVRTQSTSMKCTILGTGPSEGVPAPLCDCEFCSENIRRRPSILISKNNYNFLFDASPDIKEQLQMNDITSLDGVFVTHYHFDHSNGLRELNNTTVDLEKLGVKDSVNQTVRDHLGKHFELYCSPYTKKALSEEIAYAVCSDGFSINIIDDNESVRLQGIEVTPFITEHCHGYIGFKIRDGDRTIVYNPDHGTIRTDVEFEDVNDLVYDGSAILGYEVHGDKDDFINVINRIDPDNIYFTNVSEHIAQKTSEQLQEMAEIGQIVSDSTVI